MAMPAPLFPDTSRRDWTLDELEALVAQLPEDGTRYELLDGELLVSPAPSTVHQRVIRELVLRLLPYVDLVGYEVLFAPTGVREGRRTELQPNILALPLVAGPPTHYIHGVGLLTLTVEVLSPSTIRNDRYKKRPAFQRRGVAECWLVDSFSRVVERWRPGDAEPEVLDVRLAWQPNADVEPLLIDLKEVFRIAWGESPSEGDSGAT